MLQQCAKMLEVYKIVSVNCFIACSTANTTVPLFNPLFRSPPPPTHTTYLLCSLGCLDSARILHGSGSRRISEYTSKQQASRIVHGCTHSRTTHSLIHKHTHTHTNTHTYTHTQTLITCRHTDRKTQTGRRTHTHTHTHHHHHHTTQN